jgi:hypothetical protein
MMMMIRKYFIILFFIFIPLAASGQEKDFGIWYGVSSEIKLSKKVDLDLSTEIRTFENASKMEEALLEGGATWNFSKYIAASGSYRVAKNLEDDNSYYFQHKFFLALKGKLPVNNFTFSGTLRFQTRSKTYIEDVDDEDLDYTGKVKLKAIYKTPSFFLNPYFYSEAFLPMFSDQSDAVSKVRFSAGFELKITKVHSVEIGYIYQRDYTPRLSDLNIISLNYNISF